MIDRRDALQLSVLLVVQAGIVAAAFGFAYASRRWNRRAAEELNELRISDSCWGVDELRELIDGNQGIPSGLDAESIAAARRIARALDGVTRGDRVRVH